ncbi:MAG: hypothetical protein QOG03_1337, partial [Actinomycetota bacterium]|nr:hypothetical protein [Actinomycetota bacterium]
ATLGAPASTLAVAGDPEVATRPDAEPVACLAAAAPDPVIEIVLDQRFSPAPVEEAMVSGHPSMEGEAIAAVLLEAAAGGVAWEDMAVLVRHRSHRATALTRALARHRIPLAGAGPRPGDEPLVRGVVDLLRWAGGDVEALPRLLGSPLADIDPLVLRAVERQARDAGLALADDPAVAPLRTVRDELAERAARSTPAQLAHHVYRRLIAPTVPDPSDAAALDDAAASGLDAVVALVDGLSRWCERNPEARLDDYLSALDAPDAEPDPWRTGHRRGPGVTITSIAAATGRRWHTVVVAGCLEGELPRVSGFIPFFDPDRLNGEARPVAVRRQASLAVEQRRFHLARTRATHQLVASAGPEAKDLVSRFIIDWPRRPVALPARVHHASPALRPTEGLAPVFPSGALVLSASQLATFADCPLKYAFAYGLRVRDAGNVWASLGSLAHDILDRFLSQGDPALHTWERLLELVDECWTDDVAPYRPQRERIRRDLLDMLEGWWNEEGNDLDPASVLSTELDFDIAVGPHRVVGKIDRVDLRPDGTLEIIDYKTSQTPITQEAAADDLQLATYHLAASLTPDLMAAGAPGRLRLLFLRKMVDREQPITPDHAAVTTAKIIEAAEAILAEGYQPSVTADCDHCPFHRLCPLQAEGREVGAP